MTVVGYRQVALERDSVWTGVDDVGACLCGDRLLQRDARNEHNRHEYEWNKSHGKNIAPPSDSGNRNRPAELRLAAVRVLSRGAVLYPRSDDARTLGDTQEDTTVHSCHTEGRPANPLPTEAEETLKCSDHDRSILRPLADRKAAAADSSVNAERREAWYRHDAGAGGRPMVLAEIGGVRDEKRPISDADLECRGEWARTVEHHLRSELYQFDVLRDDHVIEPWMSAGYRVTIGNYGVEPVVHSGDHDGRMGARRWDPPIVDLDRDFHKLRPSEFHVDREASAAERGLLESVFSGILPVRPRSSYYWTMGLTWRAIELIGLEGLMLAMYDNPEGLHRLMAFLRDQHLAMAEWLESEELYTLNNENDYTGSGTLGYTRDLPVSTDGVVRTRDLWVLSESQETVGVGPQLFEEFVFPYQLAIVERFGRCYYGCCEPVHGRWHIVRRLPRLERVSVSPWADQELMAEYLGDRYVFSRKPAPSMISTDAWDEAEIRRDIRGTLEIARGCRVELIMKDVHTLNNEPPRLARWVEITREEINRSAGG